MKLHLVSACLILLCAGAGTKLTVAGFTHHSNPGDWNEGWKNNIVGVESPKRDGISIEYVNFINSFGGPSETLNINFRWQQEPNIFTGLKIGLSNGYTDKPELFFLPIITKDFEYTSIDFHWLPSVIIVFLKLRF